MIGYKNGLLLASTNVSLRCLAHERLLVLIIQTLDHHFLNLSAVSEIVGSNHGLDYRIINAFGSSMWVARCGAFEQAVAPSSLGDSMCCWVLKEAVAPASACRSRACIVHDRKGSSRRIRRHVFEYCGCTAVGMQKTWTMEEFSFAKKNLFVCDDGSVFGDCLNNVLDPHPNNSRFIRGCFGRIIVSSQPEWRSSL